MPNEEKTCEVPKVGGEITNPTDLGGNGKILPGRGMSADLVSNWT